MFQPTEPHNQGLRFLIWYQTPHTWPLLISVASSPLTPDCTLWSSNPQTHEFLSHIQLHAYVIPQTIAPLLNWETPGSTSSRMLSLTPLHPPTPTLVLPGASANCQHSPYRLCHNYLFGWPLSSGSLGVVMCLFLTVSPVPAWRPAHKQRQAWDVLNALGEISTYVYPTDMHTCAHAHSQTNSSQM